MKHKLMISIALLLTAVIILIPRSAVAEITYSGVAFQETGLPNGTLWTVNCNEQQYQSNTSYITISLPPGTYSYFVPDISGYTASPQNGTVTAILDPIKLTDITFSSSIQEFPVNIATMILLMLFIIIASIVILKLKKQ